FWLTFNQAKELGGNVKRGEKACPVVFWKWLDVEEQGKAQRVPFLRYYSVFNVGQCEGIPQDKIPALSGAKREHSAIAEAERIVESMPKRPGFKTGLDRAFYSPSGDFVGM